jgi:Xaa-Pro aminopeptidase
VVLSSRPRPCHLRRESSLPRVTELGGFRHSDAVLVTEDGIEILTHYPRDLASLIIPV